MPQFPVMITHSVIRANYTQDFAPRRFSIRRTAARKVCQRRGPVRPEKAPVRPFAGASGWQEMGPGTLSRRFSRSSPSSPFQKERRHFDRYSGALEVQTQVRRCRSTAQKLPKRQPPL